ncbi:hypothetical protein [Sphingomonas aracearum]|uniref:hypothetical protein n=1 Tax=Sphingomonas aracearum TaxID=2283317 RepID=UPI0015F07F7F|nr:hypothetical protein [Sphingomonas aracearum]
MIRWLAALLLLAMAMPAFAQAPVPPPCRRVGDVPSLAIAPDAAARMAQIGLDRAAIFARMQETSIPETMGCWGLPAGNFDSQLISVGMAQWNYGTGSLQPLLVRWTQGFGSRGRYRRARRALAPTYGKLLFSKDCLAVPVREKCRAGILAAQGPDGRNNPVLHAELTALFEDDRMLQVLLDTYLQLLDLVRLDLQRVFPAGPWTLRKVRWALDTRVQQGGLPADEDVARLRRKLAGLPEAERPARLRAILDWYGALARTVDQDGIARDADWNVAAWTCLLDHGRIDPEQYELLSLTFLRSRTAIGNSGRWQALTFERRAKIILGVGSVSGVQDGACVPGEASAAGASL